jgi:hypothetical protein
LPHAPRQIGEASSSPISAVNVSTGGESDHHIKYQFFRLAWYSYLHGAFGCELLLETDRAVMIDQVFQVWALA